MVQKFVKMAKKVKNWYCLVNQLFVKDIREALRKFFHFFNDGGNCSSPLPLNTGLVPTVMVDLATPLMAVENCKKSCATNKPSYLNGVYYQYFWIFRPPPPK